LGPGKRNDVFCHVSVAAKGPVTLPKVIPFG
jgi:hypothetical protein